jgi:hypothetical protein
LRLEGCVGIWATFSGVRLDALPLWVVSSID